MKRKILLGLLITFISSEINAQQQFSNNGFESWDTIGDYTVPTNWFTLNALVQFGAEPTTVITQDAFSGKFAVELESKSSIIGDLSGILCTGPLLSPTLQPQFNKIKIPFSSRPTALEFYYKAFPQMGDTCAITMVLTRWNQALSKTDTVGEASILFSDSISIYTKASIPFVYGLPLACDSMFLLASSSLDGFNPTIGSKLILDDLKLVYNPTSVKDEIELSSLSLFPNPTSGNLNIVNKDQSPIEFLLYSMQGELLIETTLNEEHNLISLNELKQGMYLVMLKNANGLLTQEKLFVTGYSN